MNQQARKRITSSFCVKKKWIHDKDVNNCFKCDQKFNVLYRRKHHCRFCGQIFCGKCSNFFFNGKDLGDNQKLVRMCQACYQKSWKYVVQHDQSYLQLKTSNDDQQSKIKIPQTVSSLKQKKNSQITEKDKNDLIQQLSIHRIQQYKQITQLQQEANKKINLLLQTILKQKKIPLKYFSIILQVAQNIINRNKPNALITGNMDICRYIKFKCFKAKQFSIKLKGSVLVKKNYANKKNSQIYQNKNCILVYGGLQATDFVGGDKTASFELIVSNRTKQMAKIISYCQRLGLNIIFLQKCIQKQFQNKFSQAGIIIIQKIKIDHIMKLKTALKIQKIIQNIHQLYHYTKQQIIGYIEQIHTQSFQSLKKQNQSKKYFYQIKSIKDQLGMTVLIFGNEQQLMLKIKNQFPWIITNFKYLKLRIHSILLDQQLFNSISPQLNKQNYWKQQQILFKNNNNHHLDTLSDLNQKHLSYKQITYTTSNYQNYFDPDTLNLEDYYNARPYTFRNTWQQFAQICGDISQQHLIFYSNDDTPMGIYLLSRMLLMNKKCDICKKLYSTHIDVFYSTDHCIKIWTQSKTHFNPTNQQQQISIQKFNDLSIIYSELTKQNQKGKIVCYIECRKCRQSLTSPVMLSRQNLECSKLAFLNHFFKNNPDTLIRLNNSKPKINTSKSCPHTFKNRVFSMGIKLVKVVVQRHVLSRTYRLPNPMKSIILQKQQRNYCNHYCRQQCINIQKIIQYLLQQIKKIADNSSSKLSNYQKIVQNTRSSFIQAKRSVVACSSLKLSQTQCIDMILPALVDQLKNITTISKNLLDYNKLTNLFQCQYLYYIITNFLNKNYIILNQFKKSIKKRQLQMKFKITDFCTNYFQNQPIQQNQYQEDQSNVWSSAQDYQQQSTKWLYTTSAPLQKFRVLDSSIRSQKLQKNTRKSAFNKLSRKATQQQAIRTFTQVSSFMRMQYAYVSYVPAFPHLPHTLIASALNSRQYKQFIQNPTKSYQKQLILSFNKYLQNQFYIQNQQLKKLSASIIAHERIFDIHNKIKKNNQNIYYQITILAPHQFQYYRRQKNINIQLFISSIGAAQPWMISGDHSNTSFMRSFNDLFVIKKINFKQFNNLKKILMKYFQLIGQDSNLLATIYGAFSITKNQKTDYYIVMQNLFFGMSNWYLYQIKGLSTKRLTKYPIISTDSNFIIDRNSQPIFTKNNVLKNLTTTLQFLSQNHIVDYSLIIAIQLQNKDDYYLDGNKFTLGIVDYLRDFGTIQKFQRTFKGQEAILQSPKDYKDRIQKFVKKCFTQIPL